VLKMCQNCSHLGASESPSHKSLLTQGKRIDASVEEDANVACLTRATFVIGHASFSFACVCVCVCVQGVFRKANQVADANCETAQFSKASATVLEVKTLIQKSADLTQQA